MDFKYEYHDSDVNYLGETIAEITLPDGGRFLVSYGSIGLDATDLKEQGVDADEAVLEAISDYIKDASPMQKTLIGGTALFPDGEVVYVHASSSATGWVAFMENVAFNDEASATQKIKAAMAEMGVSELSNETARDVWVVRRALLAAEVDEGLSSRIRPINDEEEIDLRDTPPDPSDHPVLRRRQSQDLEL